MNDMLQDLDARGELDQDSDLLPSNDHSETSSGRRLTIFALATGILVVIALWVGFREHGQYWISKPSLPTTATAALTQERTAQSALLIEQKRLTPTVDQHLLARVLPVIPKTREEKPNKDEVLIGRLLEQAKLALAADKLTTPFGDNAYARYQSILYLQPNHSEALVGIQQIAERYVELAQRYEAEGDLRRSQRYWVRAREIASQYAHVKTWLNSLEKPMQVAAPKESAAPTALVVRTPSAAYLDEQKSAAVSRLVREGRFVDAEVELRQFLALNPQAERSGELLLEVLLQQRRFEAAEHLLTELNHLLASEKKFHLSSIAIKQADLEKARLLLEEETPDISEYPSYYSRLAGIYNKLGMYQKARDTYQQLLQIDSKKATYWLGLALALDALKENEAALQAFRYARLYSPPDSNTQFYIGERIAELSHSG